MALVPPPATAIMLKKKGIYGHPEVGIPNKQAQTIKWARDSVSTEHEVTNQGDDVLTYR